MRREYIQLSGDVLAEVLRQIRPELPTDVQVIAMRHDPFLSDSWEILLESRLFRESPEGVMFPRFTRLYPELQNADTL